MRKYFVLLMIVLLSGFVVGVDDAQDTSFLDCDVILPQYEQAVEDCDFQGMYDFRVAVSNFADRYEKTDCKESKITKNSNEDFCSCAKQEYYSLNENCDFQGMFEIQKSIFQISDLFEGTDCEEGIICEESGESIDNFFYRDSEGKIQIKYKDYKKDGFEIEEVSDSFSVSRYYYKNDWLYKLESFIDNFLFEEIYEYDEDGNLIWFTFSLDEVVLEDIMYEYDSEGRVIRTKDFVSGYIEEFVYNEEGLVIIERKGDVDNLQERRIFYDSEGRIYAEDFGWGNIVYRNYDENSYCIDSSAGQSCTIYDENGPIMQDALTLYGFDRQWNYDAEGNVIGEAASFWHFDDFFSYSVEYDDEEFLDDYYYYYSPFGLAKAVVPDEGINYLYGEDYVFDRNFSKADFNKDGFIELEDVVKSVDKLGSEISTEEINLAISSWKNQGVI